MKSKIPGPFNLMLASLFVFLFTLASFNLLPWGHSSVTVLFVHAPPSFACVSLVLTAELAIDSMLPHKYISNFPLRTFREKSPAVFPTGSNFATTIVQERFPCFVVLTATPVFSDVDHTS